MKEPEVEALKGFLKQLFAVLGVSLTRYAARCHLDKGTVSRYFSGDRIPPQGFVDGLMLHVAEVNGHSVTGEVQQQAFRLRMDALRVRNPGAHELEKLRQHLGTAEEQLHRARVRERALLDALVQREAEAARAAQKYRELEDSWAAALSQASELAVIEVGDDQQGLDDQLRALRDELEFLRSELTNAQGLKSVAEEECLRLEAELVTAEKRLQAMHQYDAATVNPLALESRHSRLVRSAGARIGTTLDLDATVREVCGVVVPEIADFACVDLHDRFIYDAEPHGELPGGETQLRRVACSLAEALSDWRQLVSEGKVFTIPETVAALDGLDRGEPFLVNRVSPGVAADCGALLGDAKLASWFAGCSLITLPFMVRSESIGLFTLVRAPGRPPFDEVDAADLGELASRAALSIDNARLNGTEGRVALSLQRSMLPSAPPNVPGAVIAHRYLPGDQRAQVGGDWFDAVPLALNRVALVVGDVMGHGLHSAAAMGRFRSATQTVAALDLDPAGVLHLLDDLAHRLDSTYLATCLYVVYDPINRTCTMASAGHAPPVLVHPDGRGELLEISSGVPIGVGGALFTSQEVEVPDGTVLVLCTDGLIELRGNDLGEGLAALCGEVVDPQLSPDAICSALLERLHTEDRSDDLAVLVARFDGIRQTDVSRCSAAEPRDVSAVREHVRAQLGLWGLEALCDTVELLTSELVTNALRVATGEVGVQMIRGSDKVSVEVSDDDRTMPQAAPAEPQDEQGRGLSVVSWLSSRWGATRRGVGKVVWFDVNLPKDRSLPG